MTCACGHHHLAPISDDVGQPVTLSRPMVALHGQMICSGMPQMLTALDHLPGHVRLSRAEPGNLRFALSQDEDPLIWSLSELFADEDAFAAHQARTKDSDWGRASGDIKRAFHREAVQPVIRPETRADADQITELLNQAESDLVSALRQNGDLTASLVAVQGGTVLGHVALSQIDAPFAALCLAPLVVHPRLQNRGLGRALMNAAINAAGNHVLVALGDPAFYGRFGFQQVDWDSSVAGPTELARAPDGGTLPPKAEIRFAPAFDGL